MVQRSELISATWLQSEFGIESRFDRLSDREELVAEPVEATMNLSKRPKTKIIKLKK